MKGCSFGRRYCGSVRYAGSPATAQTNESPIGISITTTGPGAPRHSRAQRARLIVRKRSPAWPLKVIVPTTAASHQPPQCSALRHGVQADIIMGSSTTPVERFGVQCRQ